MTNKEFLAFSKFLAKLLRQAFPDFVVNARPLDKNNTGFVFAHRRSSSAFGISLSRCMVCKITDSNSKVNGKLELEEYQLTEQIALPYIFSAAQRKVTLFRNSIFNGQEDCQVSVLEFDFSEVTSSKPQNVLVKQDGEVTEALFWKGFHYYVRIGDVTYEIPVDEFELGYFYLIYTASEVYTNKEGKLYVRSTKSLFKGQQPPY